MERFYVDVRPKTGQEDVIAKIGIGKSQYSKIMKDVTSFTFNIESQIADSNTKLQKVQHELKLSIQLSFRRKNSSNTEGRVQLYQYRSKRDELIHK